MTTEQLLIKLRQFGRQSYQEGQYRAKGDEVKAVKHFRKRARLLEELTKELNPYALETDRQA